MGKKKKKKSQQSTKSESSEKEAESAILLRLARFEKAEGNQNFRQSQFSEAIEHYSKAIDLLYKKDVQNTLVVSLYTNRAISYLYLQNYVKAIEDCQLALELDPNYLKAYICHAFGHFYLQNYEKTFEDLEAVSRLQPTNYALQQDLKKAKEALAQHKKAEGLIKSKKIREVEWMGDFGLLSIDDDDKPQTAPPGQQPSTQTNSPTSTVTPKNANTYEPEKQNNESNKNLETPANSNFDKDSVPLLVPIGEVLSLDFTHSSPMYLDASITEEEHAAAKEKELGNKAYMECNFEKALVHYSRAIKLNWKEPVFLSNRALVYLKLNRFQEAISDCTASIDRKPSIKAFARRAAAWAQLCEYFLAAEDYKHALRFEPKNPDCLKELEKCLVHLEIDYKYKKCVLFLLSRHKLELDPNNDKLKKSLHNVREDLKRIAQKIDAATMPAPSVVIGNSQHSARPNIAEVPKQTK